MLLFLQLLLLAASPRSQRPPGRQRWCPAAPSLPLPQRACTVNLAAAATAGSVKVRVSSILCVFILLDAILLLGFMLVLLPVPLSPLPLLLLCCTVGLCLLLPGERPGCDAVEASNSRSWQVLRDGTPTAGVGPHYRISRKHDEIRHQGVQHTMVY